VRSSKVVYFQHGLLDSASAWVASGAMYGLAARAWGQGYDVFLGNLRGTDDSNDSDDETGSVGHSASDSVPVSHREHASSPPSRSASVSSLEALHAAAPVTDEGAAGLAGETVWDGGLLVREGVHTPMGDVVVARPDGEDSAEEIAAPDPAETEAAAEVAASAAADVSAESLRRPPPVPELGSGDGSDLRLGHAWLPRSSAAFWEYSVDDHTLDLMAHIDAIRDLKAAEAPLRRRQRKQHPVARTGEDEGAASTATARGTPADDAATSAKPEDRAAEQEAARAAQALAEALADEAGGATATATATTEAGSETAASGDASGAAGSEPEGARRDGGASGWGEEAEPAAYTAALSDVTIVGVGHSMGGCLLLTHLLHSRALRRHHGMCGTVLLSPAGLHRDVGLAPRVFLGMLGMMALNLVPDGPFPVRSSKLQQAAASLVQDMKRSQGTGELMGALAALFFGGKSSNFAFRRISLFDYPLGGTSVRVMAHGFQGMFGAEMTTFSFGAAENTRRFGSPDVPVYRKDFGLIDVPTDFVAGELDSLIPPANLQLLAATLEACSPGMAGYKAFRDMGHLDFTLGVSDAVISHVLGDINRFTACAKRLQPHAEAEAHHDGDTGAYASPKAPFPSFPIDTPALCRSDAKLAGVIAEGRARSHEGVSPDRWLPAAECARQYPFLNCYFKRELAFRGLDQRRARLWKAFHAEPAAVAFPSPPRPAAPATDKLPITD
jgi:pimeloyl-ACP methyl ester carboxylesterase